MQKNSDTVKIGEEGNTGSPTFQEAIDELRGNKKPGDLSNIDSDTLSEKKTILNKVIYILQCSGYITEKSPEEDIIALREKFGALLTKKSLNTVLGEMTIDENEPLQLPKYSLQILPSEFLEIWKNQWKELFYSHWDESKNLRTALYNSAIELVESDSLNYTVLRNIIKHHKKNSYISKMHFIRKIIIITETKMGIKGVLETFGIPKQEVREMQKIDNGIRIGNSKWNKSFKTKKVRATHTVREKSTINPLSVETKGIYMLRLHQIGIHENTVKRILKYYKGINEGNLYNILQDPICKDDLIELQKKVIDGSYVLKNLHQSRKNFEEEFYILSSKLDTFSLNVIANSREKSI